MTQTLTDKGKIVTDMINSTIQSIKNTLPFDMSIAKPSVVKDSFAQREIGVLIGMTGDLKGRLVIDGTKETMKNIGEAMFGMQIGDDMLESFTGELGNMIAGNLATTVAQKGVTIDITPPTVMVGSTKLHGFERAILVPVTLDTQQLLQVVLMLEQK